MQSTVSLHNSNNPSLFNVTVILSVGICKSNIGCGLANFPQKILLGYQSFVADIIITHNPNLCTISPCPWLFHFLWFLPQRNQYSHYVINIITWFTADLLFHSLRFLFLVWFLSLLWFLELRFELSFYVTFLLRFLLSFRLYTTFEVITSTSLATLTAARLE